MFKKLLLACIAFILTMGMAFAQVEVNKADQAALDGVKGIGPATSKAIIAERTKGGEFKDWADLQKRVKGIGDKNSSKLSQAGLTVNGQAKAGAPAASASAAASAPASASSSAKASAPAASASATAPKK
ncbi:MAG TPA: helix-hairpin-helix domain-containing protein [Burkholderiaceae bacterium]|jgi:DNA polymerase III alpha subunit